MINNIEKFYNNCNKTSAKLINILKKNKVCNEPDN